MKNLIYAIIMTVLCTAGASFGELIGMWNFSEGEGQNTYSEVGAITMQRGTSQSTWADALWDENGLSGYCFRFVNEKGTSEDNRDFLTPLADVDVTPAISPQFTLDAWINLASIPQGFTDNDPYYVVWAGDRENVNSNNYFIRVDTNGTNLRNASLLAGFYYDNAGTPTYKSFNHTTKIEPAVWYRVVFSYDPTLPSGNAKIWINGSLYTANSTFVPITTGYTTPWLVIGAARRTGSHFRCFDGLIDQFRIYNHAVQSLSELDDGDCNYPGVFRTQADINGDCIVNIKDFSLVAQTWLDCTDPTNTLCN